MCVRVTLHSSDPKVPGRMEKQGQRHSEMRSAEPQQRGGQ